MMTEERKFDREIKHFENLKEEAMNTLNERLREIEKYKFAMVYNWRVSQAKRLIEEMQIYTTVIQMLKDSQEEDSE